MILVWGEFCFVLFCFVLFNLPWLNDDSDSDVQDASKVIQECLEQAGSDSYRQKDAGAAEPEGTFADILFFRVFSLTLILVGA